MTENTPLEAPQLQKFYNTTIFNLLKIFKDMKWLSLSLINTWTPLSWIIVSAAALYSCYSFKGISIDPNVHTYNVKVFTDHTSAGVPVNLLDNFTVALDKRIRTETRLKPNDESPDLVFKGELLSFRVTPGPISNEESTTFNRLEVSVSIDYVNHINPKDKWKQTFSHYEEFPADQNLSDVQDELLKQITNKLIEDIFNKAFTNW